MTSRYDPRALDAAWDAMIAGGSFTEEDGDAADHALLDLLKELPRSAPSANFVQTLGQTLSSASKTAPRPTRGMNVTRASKSGVMGSITSIYPTYPNARRRWMHASYALAALALVVVLSAVGIAYQGRHANEPVIPAVSQRAGQGPATSTGVTTASWFSHSFTVDELTTYAVDQWSWIGLAEGTIGSGEPPQTSDGTGGAGDDTTSGMHILIATNGELAVELKGPAQLFRPDASSPTDVEPGTTTLQTGDTLIYPLEAFVAFWNPSNDPADFFAGWITAGPPYAFVRPDRTQTIDYGGDAVPPGFAAGVKSIDMSIGQVVIGPGETFGYTISPQTLLLGKVAGGLLEKQGWVNGEKFGKPLKVISLTYIFSNYGTGYFTLTNPGSKPVTVSLFQVAPPDTGNWVNPPSEPVDSPFGTFSPTQPAPASS